MVELADTLDIAVATSVKGKQYEKNLFSIICFGFINLIFFCLFAYSGKQHG